MVTDKSIVRKHDSDERLEADHFEFIRKIRSGRQIEIVKVDPNKAVNYAPLLPRYKKRLQTDLDYFLESLGLKKEYFIPLNVKSPHGLNNDEPHVEFCLKETGIEFEMQDFKFTGRHVQGDDHSTIFLSIHSEVYFDEVFEVSMKLLTIPTEMYKRHNDEVSFGLPYDNIRSGKFYSPFVESILYHYARGIEYFHPDFPCVYYSTI